MRIRLGLGLGFSTLVVAGTLLAAEGDLAGLRRQRLLDRRPSRGSIMATKGPPIGGKSLPPPPPVKKALTSRPLIFGPLPITRAMTGS